MLNEGNISKFKNIQLFAALCNNLFTTFSCYKMQSTIPCAGNSSIFCCLVYLSIFYWKYWLLQILFSTYFNKIIIMNIQQTTSEKCHWLKSMVSTGTCCRKWSHMCAHLYHTWVWATRRDNMMMSSRKISRKTQHNCRAVTIWIIR